MTVCAVQASNCYSRESRQRVLGRPFGVAHLPWALCEHQFLFLDYDHKKRQQTQSRLFLGQGANSMPPVLSPPHPHIIPGSIFGANQEQGREGGPNSALAARLYKRLPLHQHAARGFCPPPNNGRTTTDKKNPDG